MVKSLRDIVQALPLSLSLFYSSGSSTRATKRKKYKESLLSVKRNVTHVFVQTQKPTAVSKLFFTFADFHLQLLSFDLFSAFFVGQHGDKGWRHVLVIHFY